VSYLASLSVLKFLISIHRRNLQNKKTAAGIALQKIQGHNHLVAPQKCEQI
jgi:hypothetical protein